MEEFLNATIVFPIACTNEAFKMSFNILGADSSGWFVGKAISRGPRKRGLLHGLTADHF